MEPLKDEKIWLEEWKMLIELLNYEGDRFWTRFSILLGINSALIATISYFISQGVTYRSSYPTSIICLLGIIFSIV